MISVANIEPWNRGGSHGEEDTIFVTALALLLPQKYLKIQTVAGAKQPQCRRGSVRWQGGR